jgi:Spy/CpxP family protein refolding chaperone
MESFQSFNHHSGRSKPQPAVFSPGSPPRISSAPQPSSKKSHLPSLHHHSHRHHHHHRHGKSTVQSAVQLHAPTSFGDLLKQASRSKDNSPSHSRRESVAVTSTENNGETSKAEPKRKPVQPDDVERERARAKAREEYVFLHSLPTS